MLCVSNLPPEQAKNILESYLPMLMRRYDAKMFNVETLEEVAAQSKFFPSYGELCERLDAIRRRATTPHGVVLGNPIAITFEKPKERTEAELDAVAAVVSGWKRECAERQSSQPSRDMKQAVNALPLTPQQLRQEYERLAGDTRYTADQRGAAKVRLEVM